MVFVAGAFLGYVLWGIAGGSNRGLHWLGTVLWGSSAVAGFWTAVDAARFDRGESKITSHAALLCLVHTLSLLILYLFVGVQLHGGPGLR